MKTKELKVVLKKHKKWLKDEVGGVRADLRCADLSDADLRGADLRGADLSDANLSCANIDYSCLPLWCGSLNIKVDKRIARQIAYHLCSMQCDDKEFIKMRNSILSFANKFHRVDECGVLEEIK